MASCSLRASDARAMPSLASSPMGFTNAGYSNRPSLRRGLSRDDTTKRATRTWW